MKTIGRIEKWGQVTQLQGKNGTMTKCEVVIKDIGGDFAAANTTLLIFFSLNV